MQAVGPNPSDANFTEPTPRRRTVASRLLMPLLILVISVLFHWKLTLTDQFTWMEHPDAANQVLPWLQFQAIQWHGRHIPAWDPNAWTGQPLFGQAQPGSAYPFNWLLFLWPMQNGLIGMAALNWYYVLIRYTGALAGYALCRDLGCSRIASLTGACIFAMGGFVGTNGWPQMVNGAVWAPVVFLFLFRAERGERPLRNSLLSGFFLGFSWLSGHHQVPMYLTVAAAATWGWLCIRGGKWNGKVAKLAVASLAIAALASAFQTWPTAEYGRLSVRWVGTPEPLAFNETTPYYVHETYAHKPTSLLSVFLPVLLPAWIPFIGVTALALALLGVILAWRQKQVPWLGCLALCAILYTLGANSLLHGVLYAVVPLLEKSRSAGAATALFGMAIAPLSALGVDRVFNSASHWWVRRTAWVMAGFGAVLGGASAVFALTGATGAAADPRLLMTALITLAFAVLLFAQRANAISVRGGAVAVLLLVLFELAQVTDFWMYSYGPNFERTPLLNNLRKHNDIARFLLDRPDHGRIEYHDTDIPYNFGDFFGVETFQAYTASMTENIWRHEIFQPRVRDFLGVRYSIAKQPERPGQRQIFEGSSGLKVFENPGALPRVWAVHELSLVPDRKAAGPKLVDPAFDARRTAFLIGENTPPLEACANRDADRVERTLNGANRVTIAANLACPAMVIVDDTWYPGWRATVDGRPARIYEAYGVFRGIMAPAGQHTIDMRFRPASVIGGALLTLLAAVIAGCAAMGWPRRQASLSNEGMAS